MQAPFSLARLGTLILLLTALMEATPAKAQSPQLGESLANRSFNILIEAAYRYPLMGQGRVDRTEGHFRLSYHGAVTTMIGGASGFYGQARFDGYGPTGRGPFPFMVSGRLGYFVDVHEFDRGGLRTSTSRSRDTECRQVTTYSERCTTTTTTTTRQWWEPAGWVHGARYFFAGVRQLMNVEADTAGHYQNPTAISLGVGATESKFGTFTNEIELFYYLRGFGDSDRSRWGFAYHGQVLFGPAFFDLQLQIDKGLGGELSVGLGFILAP